MWAGVAPKGAQSSDPTYEAMHQGALKRASRKALLVSRTAAITSDKASIASSRTPIGWLPAFASWVSAPRTDWRAPPVRRVANTDCAFASGAGLAINALVNSSDEI